MRECVQGVGQILRPTDAETWLLSSGSTCEGYNSTSCTLKQCLLSQGRHASQHARRGWRGMGYRQEQLLPVVSTRAGGLVGRGEAVSGQPGAGEFQE